MANSILDQLITVLQNLKTHTSNLNKDLDNNDQREETRGDLKSIFTNFEQLQKTLTNLDQTDMDALQNELKQLLKGEQSFSDYNRDVNNILTQVRKRIERDEQTKDKVTENLPAEQKTKSVGTVFDGWQSILSKVQHWIEQNTSSQNTGGSKFR